MPSQELIVRPQDRVSRAEVRVKKLELQLQREAKLFDLVTGLATHPAVIYVSAVLLLEYLCTHPKDNIELFGIGAGGYITKDTAKVITGGLTAGLAANALGGGAGIGALIKAVK